MYIAALTPTQFAIYRSYGTHRHSSKCTPPHEQIYKYIAKLAKPELIFTIDYICTRNKMQLLLRLMAFCNVKLTSYRNGD